MAEITRDMLTAFVAEVDQYKANARNAVTDNPMPMIDLVGELMAASEMSRVDIMVALSGMSEAKLHAILSCATTAAGEILCSALETIIDKRDG